jgi:hypothetical protein
MAWHYKYYQDEQSAIDRELYRLQKMKRARQGWDYGVTRIPFRRGNFGMGIDFSLKNVIREMHCRFLTNFSERRALAFWSD